MSDWKEFFYLGTKYRAKRDRNLYVVVERYYKPLNRPEQWTRTGSLNVIHQAVKEGV